MAGFGIRQTGTYLPSEAELRSYFKDKVYIPIPLTTEWLEANGVEPVFEGPQATGGNRYQFSQFAGIELVGGKLYTKYILGPNFVDNENGTAAEQETAYIARRDADQAIVVRSDRDRRLAETDWTQVADSPVDKAAWAMYRQALRDVPTQAGFPWDVQWPVKP